VAEPRILLFDIESLPNLDAALSVWPQLSNYPGQTLRASINSVLCIGWKIYGEDKVHCIKAWDFPEWKDDVNNDKKVVEEFQKIVVEADCVIGHNSKRFDWPFIQTRLRKYDLPPMPNVHHVDTCAEVKRNLFLFNNRLNTVAKFLTDVEKMEHEGWDLWVKAHGGDREALKTMEEYCKKDVIVLEEVFRKLRPVIQSLPNFNLFSENDKIACPNCGSTRLVSNGNRFTSTKCYKRYICKDCRTWSRTDIKDEFPRKI